MDQQTLRGSRSGISRRDFTKGACAALATMALGTPARAADAVRLAIAPTSLTYLPIYWALDKGYFAEVGIEPKMLQFSGGPAATAALLGGSVDIITGGTVSLIKVAGKGQDLVGIAGIQALPTVAVVMRKNLADALGRKPTVRDLKGLRVGTPPRGGFADMCMHYVLVDAGMSPAKDVQLVQFNNFSAILKAGEVGQLDAALLIEPFQHVAVDLTKQWTYVLHVTVGEGPQVMQQLSYASLMSTRAYLKDNRDKAERVVKAIVKGAAACNDRRNIDAMIEVSKKVVPDLDPLVLRKSVETQVGTFVPQLTPQHIAKTVEFLEKTDNLGGSAPKYEQAVETSFQKLWG